MDYKALKEAGKQINFKEYLMSEKLDGIRAFWDGKRFLSRTNKEFAAPRWFSEGFSNEPLDGELWIARGEFEQTASTVMKKDPHEGWKKIKYMVYDLPGWTIPFFYRLAHLQGIVEKAKIFNKYIEYLPHQYCETEEKMEELYHNIIKVGGEGLMLKQMHCPPIVTKSSKLLLKYKKFYDMEGRVIGYTQGKGKYINVMGNLIVKIDGGTVSIGTGFSDLERENPPPIGALVTFTYQGLTNHGNPRFPSFMRERKDPVPEEKT